MFQARLRFASLWLSQTSRTLADNCLRMFIVLEVGGIGQQQSEAAWYQTGVFFFAPFIFLAPSNGAISNSLPKRWVLTGSSVFALGMTVLLGMLLDGQGNPWNWCLGLLVVMVGAAVYNPARYALLPAVAFDAHLPLPRVNGWIEMGSAAGVVAGLILGVSLRDMFWPAGIPVAVAATAGFYLIATLACAAGRFPCRCAPPGTAGAGRGGLF